MSHDNNLIDLKHVQEQSSVFDFQFLTSITCAKLLIVERCKFSVLCQDGLPLPLNLKL